MTTPTPSLRSVAALLTLAASATSLPAQDPDPSSLSLGELRELALGIQSLLRDRLPAPPGQSAPTTASDDRGVTRLLRRER
jgi:hypothetical protein